MSSPMSSKYSMIFLPIMIIINKMNLASTDTAIMAIRIGYATILLSSIGLTGMAYRRVLLKKDLTKIFASPPGSVSMVATAAEKNPPRMLTTIMECEVSRCKAAMQTTMLGACITCFLHFYSGVTTVFVSTAGISLAAPLDFLFRHWQIMQMMMLPMNLWDLPPFRIYVLGMKMDRPYNEKYEGCVIGNAIEPTDLLLPFF
jgi:hypothetical protein